jgi:hypothetical protein
MILCDVSIESDLPDVWVNLASNGGKRDRQIIEATFREIATELGMQGATPVVTPSLAKKIVDMRPIGNNLDNLEEGISPFSMVMIDNSRHTSEITYQAAIKAARNYDDLVKGVTVPLEELNTVQITKAVIPKTFVAAKAMLKAFDIALVAVIGEQHVMTHQYKCFMDDLEKQESFYADRIEKCDPIFGPSRLLRFVQLHVRAWFLKVLEATDHARARARAIKLPPLHKPSEKMLVNNMTWLPEMPIARSKHLAFTFGHTENRGNGTQNEKLDETHAGYRTSGNNDAQRPKLTIVNPQRNKIFEGFSTKIASIKVRTAIAKVGHPPTVQRDGHEVTMCVS